MGAPLRRLAEGCLDELHPSGCELSYGFPSVPGSLERRLSFLPIQLRRLDQVDRSCGMDATYCLSLTRLEVRGRYNLVQVSQSWCNGLQLALTSAEAVYCQVVHHI